MYIGRFAGDGIACNEDVPFFDDDSVNVSEDLLDYDLLSLYYSVGGSIIVWRHLNPKTYPRLDSELRKKGL